MQYRQSCDSTILQSIFGHKDKDKDKGTDKHKVKGSDKEKEKEKAKNDEKTQGVDEGKEGEEAGHPPLSTSQASLSLSLFDDSTDFLQR